MYKILEKQRLHPTVTYMKIDAPLVSRNAKAGQFVILRSRPEGERIPLTIYEAKDQTISIIYQVVGASTRYLDQLEVGDSLVDVAGPLGVATKLDYGNRIVVVGGGLGCAIAYPIVRALKEAGKDVTSIIGFRSGDLVILEKEFSSSSKTIVVTDDGSYGEKGVVTMPLERLLKKESIDVVYAVGPLVMMKYVSLLTKQYQVKTIVSMNSIMVDGTGMCGGCRLTIDGKVKFACVDGPDFDGHLVDFDEAIARSTLYAKQEKRRDEAMCNLLRKVPHE
ncbi:MAG: sulfide/dihydroorotate dehydrogenase-like FAD/NAD-binding protein [Bacilli bacterium]|nr:sulfide/dihydroorotate dehydrogenase-like FAD/NAD-binding protein [Bacilli bacterium]